MEATPYLGSKIWREINNLREQQGVNCLLVNMFSNGPFPYLEEGIFYFKWANAKEIFSKCLELAGYDMIIDFSVSGNIQFPSVEMERKFKAFFNAGTSSVDSQDEYSVLGAAALGNRLFQVPNNTVESGRVISRVLAETKLKVALIVSRVDILLPKSGVDPTLVDTIKSWVDNASGTPHFLIFLTDNLEEIHPSFQLVLDRQIKVIKWGKPNKEELKTLYLCLSIIYPNVFDGILIDILALESEGLSYSDILGVLKKYIEKGMLINIEEIQKHKADIESLNARKSTMVLKEKPNMKLDDVAGLVGTKQLIMRRIILPIKHPELAKTFKISKRVGLLLLGPPGNGKTLIGKGLAGELNAVFFYVRPSDLIKKWVGDSEENVRKLFSDARSCKLSVIFIDEVDSLAINRDVADSNFMLRFNSELLSQIDGVDTDITNNKMIIIGTTNKPWLIDQAYLRPGRFDAKIFVPLPDLAAREAILKIHLRDRPLEKDFDFTALAVALKDYSGADIKGICDTTAEKNFLNSIQNKTNLITTENVTNTIQRTKPSARPEDIRQIINWAIEQGCLIPGDVNL